MGMAQSNTDSGRFASATIPNAASGSPSVEELLAFERMLADLSARMANVPADLVEAEIRMAQATLRQFLGFDRSTFAEFHDDGSLVVVSSTAIEGVEATPLGPLPARLALLLIALGLSTIAGSLIFKLSAAVQAGRRDVFAVDDGL